MAYRVSSDEVKAIIDTEVEDVLPFIIPADILITELLGNSTLSEDHLKEITKWLSAHFVAIRDPRAVSEKIGSAEMRYSAGANTYTNSMKDVSGLNETSYGKQVLLLDTTGILKAQMGKLKASFEVMG